MRRRRTGAGRKLLVASVGVAAVTYVACSSGDGTSNPPADAGMDVVANLVAPDSGNDDAGGQDAGQDVNQLDVVANLVAPDTGTEDAPDDSTSNPLDVVANLVAPDTGTD